MDLVDLLVDQQLITLISTRTDSSQPSTSRCSHLAVPAFVSSGELSGWNVFLEYSQVQRRRRFRYFHK